MIKQCKLFFIMFCTVFSTGCARDMVLEFKDIQSFHIEVISKKEESVKIRLSGLAFHSSLAVKDMKVERREHEMQIIIFLSRAKLGMSGSFEYTLTLPSDVSIVTLGQERKLIWDRRHH
ncbi:MAG: hypothetical protein D3907_03545 [Candidatus Electrothrix sp. AUS3]|nr:hypothetical protein [Candidatus Electrothrix gigas]